MELTEPLAPRLRSCNQCRHYYITHDVNFPYGCRAMDFKSRRQPINDVMDASGQECHYFLEKTSR